MTAHIEIFLLSNFLDQTSTLLNKGLPKIPSSMLYLETLKYKLLHLENASMQYWLLESKKEAENWKFVFRFLWDCYENESNNVNYPLHNLGCCVYHQYFRRLLNLGVRIDRNESGNCRKISWGRKVIKRLNGIWW